MKLYINKDKFVKLQSDLKLTETKMANKISVSRSQLWRAKAGDPIGEKFLVGFMIAFPNLKVDEFFLPTVLQDSDTIKEII
ncbi:hypothetical protein [uncultured Tissierella sp.]|uniref:hypothetical protein n=1 Tax=uncultured Tissierella sp. TaxID=448160 RepID=UPI00280658A3|nr:hypothetical protein [uncultured Tissierella sp.]MDU5080285.1 hypothetical protein [Bacillota bacterium]